MAKRVVRLVARNGEGEQYELRCFLSGEMLLYGTSRYLRNICKARGWQVIRG